MYDSGCHPRVYLALWSVAPLVPFSFGEVLIDWKLTLMTAGSLRRVLHMAGTPTIPRVIGHECRGNSLEESGSGGGDFHGAEGMGRTASYRPENVGMYAGACILRATRLFLGYFFYLESTAAVAVRQRRYLRSSGEKPQTSVLGSSGCNFHSEGCKA